MHNSPHSADPAPTSPNSEGLQQGRQRLQARQRELAERLMRIHRDRQHRDQPLPASFSEQVPLRENDEVLDRLAESTTEQLQQVTHALECFQEGRYGHCEICASEIDLARLTALPEATACRRCAAAKH